MGVDEVADELYGLTPDEFTAARNDRVKAARSAKDSDLATAIAALRKPSTVAWLANLATRELPGEVSSLVDLGAALREASASLSGPELKALSGQRHQVVYSMVRQVAALAADRGPRVTSEVSRALEETFTAAVTDEAAGELLRSGRLTTALIPGGFGQGFGAPTRAAASTKPQQVGPTGAQRAEQRRRDQERQRIERELVRAHTQARKAEQVAESKAEAFHVVQRELADAGLEVADLQQELARAERARAVSQSASTRAQGAEEQAQSAAEAARATVDSLQAQLDECRSVPQGDGPGRRPPPRAAAAVDE